MKILFIIGCLSLMLSASSKQYEHGKQIYENACVTCHGKNGKTDPTIKFVVKPRSLAKSILTQQQMHKIIETGARKWGAHSDMMPAFEDVLNKNEIEAVAVYISQAFNNDRDQRVKKLMSESDSLTQAQKSNMMNEGKEIFKRKCAYCHGQDGSGKSWYVQKTKAQKEMIYPYSLKKAKLNEDQIFLYTKFGGKYWGADKSDMPAWADRYNDYELKSVAKFIVENIQEK